MAVGDFVVVAGDALLPDERLGEELVGAGLTAGAVKRNRLRRPSRIEILPGADGGVGFPELPKLIDGQARDGIVGRIDDDGNAVEGNLESS